MRVSIGAEIRRLRLDAGLSLRRLADMAGIDHGHLSLIERGLREPSLAVLTSIADALGGSITPLFFSVWKQKRSFGSSIHVGRDSSRSPSIGRHAA